MSKSDMGMSAGHLRSEGRGQTALASRPTGVITDCFEADDMMAALATDHPVRVRGGNGTFTVKKHYSARYGEDRFTAYDADTGLTHNGDRAAIWNLIFGGE